MDDISEARHIQGYAKDRGARYGEVRSIAKLVKDLVQVILRKVAMAKRDV
jgi:hypothetical protein